jgi:putative copper export protein/methionine-rich copper-binding protein CopC
MSLRYASVSMSGHKLLRWRASRALVVALCLLIVVPRIADAHTELKASTPRAGAHLAAVPREIRLEFSEVPELAFSSVQLLDPMGAPVRLSAAVYAADSKRAVISIVETALTAGDYTVVWQVAGDDGHPVRGRFQFTIAPGAAGIGMAPAAGQEAGTGIAEPHHNPVTIPLGSGFDAESPAYVVIRWLGFAAILGIIGAAVFRQVVLRFIRYEEAAGNAAGSQPGFIGDAAVRAAVIGVRACAVLAIALFARLVAQSIALHGWPGIVDASLLGTMLMKTVWGWGWLLQLLAVVVAYSGFRSTGRESMAASRTTTGWAMATAGALLLAFTPALGGHAAAAPRWQLLTILADGLHVLGAGGWLGSLLLVVSAGIPAAFAQPGEKPGPAVADLVNAFSPTALMFAGVVASTGVFAAWLHVGSILALWQTTYGKILLAKLAVLSVVAATGAYNWLRVKPSLGQIEGAVRIRNSARVELMVGVIVLLITAVLVATPTAMDMAM